MPDPYRPALLVYLDILGFRELIQESENDLGRRIEIRKVLEKLKSHIQGHRVEREDGKNPTRISRAFNFSDLTVRATFLDKQTNLIDVLRWEFMYVSAIQCELTCQSGILLRGGITIGEISMDAFNAEDDIIFGPALVRSYELESKIAMFPRVVIDRDILRRASEEKEPLWKDYIAQGEDGTFFLDYLYPAATTGIAFPNNEPLYMEKALEVHRQVVERKLNGLTRENKSKKHDDGITQKILWLANYHNSTTKRLIGIYQGNDSKAANELKKQLIEETLLALTPQREIMPQGIQSNSMESTWQGYRSVDGDIKSLPHYGNFFDLGK